MPGSFPLGFQEVLRSGGLILLLLLCVSVYSVAVIWEKWALFRKAFRDWDAFLARLRRANSAGNFEESIRICRQSEAAAGHILLSVFSPGTWQMRKRAFDRALAEHCSQMEKGLPTLGTIGSTAPFVGLLGTVIGIIHAFRGLAAQAASAHTAVAAGIAEALVNTAMGLLVAIPAVVAYNYFSSRLVRFSERMNAAAEETLDAIVASEKQEKKVNA